MAVITRFIVVRDGVELDKVFEVKKEAEAYDKMLDAAENLAAFIKNADLKLDLDTKTIDGLSIYLAKNAPEVTRMLKGIKPLSSAKPAAKPAAKRAKAAGRKPPAKPRRARAG